MFGSRLKSAWALVIFIAMLALGACDGEIPPEYLSAAEKFEGSGPGDLSIDLEPLNAELEFVGEVQFISTSEWQIANLGFVVDASTEFKGSIEIGDLAKVHASLTRDGALLASEIEPAEEEAAFIEDGDGASPFNLEIEFSFVGSVDTIDTVMWIVAGRKVVILPDTEIKDPIAEGDLVEIHVFLNGAGELAAREIGLALADELDDDDLDDDRDLKLVGVVEEMGDGSWIIDGVELTITSDTKIQDEITVGDLVEVYFFTSDDGTSIAREIELEDESEQDLDEADDDLFDNDDLEEYDLEDDDGDELDDHSGSESHDDDDDRSGRNSNSEIEDGD